MSAIIIAIATCRYCPRQLSDAEVKTGAFGNPAAGYTCPNCIVKLHFGYKRMMIRWTEQATMTIDMPLNAAPSPCVICGSVDAEFYRSVWVGCDSEIEYVCATLRPMESPCEATWELKNRQQIGPQAQFEDKLK